MRNLNFIFTFFSIFIFLFSASPGFADDQAWVTDKACVNAKIKDVYSQFWNDRPSPDSYPYALIAFLSSRQAISKVLEERQDPASLIKNLIAEGIDCKMKSALNFLIEYAVRNKLQVSPIYAIESAIQNFDGDFSLLNSLTSGQAPFFPLKGFGRIGVKIVDNPHSDALLAYFSTKISLKELFNSSAYDLDENSLMHMLASGRSVELLKKVHSLGGSLEIKNKWGESPYFYFLRNLWTSLDAGRLSLAKAREFQQYLFENSSPAARTMNDNGARVLHYLLRFVFISSSRSLPEQNEILEYWRSLVERNKSDINSRDSYGSTPLIYYSPSFESENGKYILRNTDRRSDTNKLRQKEINEFVLGLKPDINALNKFNKTALIYSFLQNENEDLRLELLKSGADENVGRIIGPNNRMFTLRGFIQEIFNRNSKEIAILQLDLYGRGQKFDKKLPQAICSELSLENTYYTEFIKRSNDQKDVNSDCVRLDASVSAETVKLKNDLDSQYRQAFSGQLARASSKTHRICLGKIKQEYKRLEKICSPAKSLNEVDKNMTVIIDEIERLEQTMK